MYIHTCTGQGNKYTHRVVSEKPTTLGGIQTHDIVHSRKVLYQLSKGMYTTQLYMYTAYRLYSVADAKDEFVLFSHAVDKLHGNEASVIGTGELPCSTIQCSSKPVSLCVAVNGKSCTEN